MFIRSYSELIEKLAKEMPKYEYVMTLGVLYLSDPDKKHPEASVNITPRGYLLMVHRNQHEGTYTDVENLISSLQMMLRD